MPGSPAEDTAPAISRGRRVAIVVLTVLATLVLVVSSFATWADRQLLDSDEWTTTSSELLQQPAVRAAVAGAVTDELMTALKPGDRIAAALPDDLKPAAAPIAASVRPALERSIDRLLGAPQVQRIWSTLNRVSHEQAVKILKGEGNVVLGRTVVLDLRPLTRDIAERAGLPPAIVDQVANSGKPLRIVKENDLEGLQTAVDVFERLVVVLGLLCVALYAAAIALTPKGRRRETVRAVGLAFVVGGVVLLVVKRIAGQAVVDAAGETEAGRDVGVEVWDVATRLLTEISWAVILIGLAMAVCAWLAGPGRAGAWLRRTAGPWVERSPVLAVVGVLVLVLLVIAYAPIPALRQPIGAVLYLIGCFALCSAMVHAARREGVVGDAAYQPLAASPKE